jgi:hypothetical protein
VQRVESLLAALDEESDPHSSLIDVCVESYMTANLPRSMLFIFVWRVELLMTAINLARQSNKNTAQNYNFPKKLV